MAKLMTWLTFCLFFLTLFATVVLVAVKYVKWCWYL